MAVHLITGYKGTEHIQSKDARSFNAAMFGAGEFVMEIGEQIDASIINNNTVRVLDGDILMQGGHIRIETDTYEDLTIQTGTAGKKRIDLIVMTYEKDASQGTETAFLEVIKGTETEGTPSEPSYVTGTLAEGDLKNQMPLYKVTIEGVVLSTIEPLFKTIPTYKTLAEQYAAQFQKACDTYLGALNVLDTKEEIMANTLANQIAGALGVKEGFNEINNSLQSKISFENIATVKPGESVDITIPFNSAGFIVFNGASSTMQSFFQYFGFSNGIAGKTIGSQGTAVSYTMKSGTTNVLSVTNLSGGNGLIVDAIALRGDFPH